MHNRIVRHMGFFFGRKEEKTFCLVASECKWHLNGQNEKKRRTYRTGLDASVQSKIETQKPEEAKNIYHP